MEHNSFIQKKKKIKKLKHLKSEYVRLRVKLVSTSSSFLRRLYTQEKCQSWRLLVAVIGVSVACR